MSKPSWRMAPEWAKHLTLTISNKWIWTEKEYKSAPYGLGPDFNAIGKYAWAHLDDVLSEQRPNKTEEVSWITRFLTILGR